MLKQDDYVKSRLVEVAWRWTTKYNGGFMGGQMIMSVLANRVRCGWGNWLEVIDRVPKYMAENEFPELKHPSVWEPSFVKLLHVVDGVYDGSAVDMSNGALYWADLSTVERSWFKDLLAATNPTIIEDGSGVELRQHPMVANVNSLSFFR